MRMHSSVLPVVLLLVCLYACALHATLASSMPDPATTVFGYLAVCYTAGPWACLNAGLYWACSNILGILAVGHAGHARPSLRLTGCHNRQIPILGTRSITQIQIQIQIRF